MRRPLPAENSDQSERRTQIRKQTNREHSIQTFSPQKDIDSPNNSNFDSQAPKMSKMDRVNGIDLQFSFQKTGTFPRNYPPTDRTIQTSSTESNQNCRKGQGQRAETWNIVLRNKTEKKLRN